MKSSMLKLLTITTLLNISLFGSNDLDTNILKYEQKKVSHILKRQHIILNTITISLKKDIKQNGWFGYVFNLNFTINGKVLNQKDTLFTNGTMISPDLINMKTKRSFKNLMYPTLSKKYFTPNHLIAGNKDAKHTLVLFSDPLCPICIDDVPSIIKDVMNHPIQLALYYYNLPLDMHPTAKVISKASILLEEQGVKNIDFKIYSANLPKKYNFDQYEETNKQKVLDDFNTEFNTHITMKQIDTAKLNQYIKNDIKMSDDAFVQGTPTLFFDGEIDKTRSKYKHFIK